MHVEIVVLLQKKEKCCTIALRSLDHNFAGKYNDGKKYFDFKHQMLLDELEIDMDYDKYRYYILLDELF